MDPRRTSQIEVHFYFGKIIAMRDILYAKKISKYSLYLIISSRFSRVGVGFTKISFYKFCVVLECGTDMTGETYERGRETETETETKTERETEGEGEGEGDTEGEGEKQIYMYLCDLILKNTSK